MPFLFHGNSSRRNIRNVDLESVGLFWSTFFAPWGPVLRYSGWVLFLAGYIASSFRTTRREGRILFERRYFLLISLFILWGGISSLLGADSFYRFGRGFSLPLEFAFGIFMAYRCFPKKGCMKTWETCIVLSVVVATLWTFVEFSVVGSFDGPFSNINTLGLYACVVTPLVLAVAISKVGSKAFRILAWISVGGAVFMLAGSFSLAAWISGGFSVLVLCLSCRERFDKRIAFGVNLAALTCISLFIVLISAYGADYFEASFARESDQAVSIVQSESMRQFTDNRSLIWQGTWRMIKMKPVVGWGWHMLRYKFDGINPEISKQLDGTPLEAHNMYMELLFNGGVPNLLMLLIIWGAAMAGLCKCCPAGPVAVGMFASLSGLLVFSAAGNIFASRNIACIVWYMIGYGFIFPRLGNAERRF